VYEIKLGCLFTCSNTSGGSTGFNEEKNIIGLRIRGLNYKNTHHSKKRAVPLKKAAEPVRSIKRL
jgi:hypothetical protein